MNSNVSHWLKVFSGLFLLACLLPGTAAAKSAPVKLSVEYVYALDGTLSGRVVNGRVQNFEYDKRGQLLAVRDAQGNDLERYVYDPAGNILSKTVLGKTTRFTYDAANQITSRTDPDGSVIRYQYDAAGRLISEGNRTYHYGWQDKVEEIRENGKTVAKFTYGLDGQLESVTRADGSVEHFYWDGLALIGRGKSTFLNEPYVTGGNPIASDGKAMLNDMLGSTVGIRDGEKMTPVAMTAFGETADPGAMYTGKPHVDGLGYAFLFRNYRAELGKWQTADPLGYPDGWNQLAYCNNDTMVTIDWLGALSYVVNNVEYTFLRWEYISTYAVISMHDGNPDGTNITRIIWGTEFNVYKPVYSTRCVDPTCVDYNKLLGEVQGGAIAGVAYGKPGNQNGVFVVVPGVSATGVPTSPVGLYYSVAKSRESYPSQIPTGVSYSNHTHKAE